MLFDMVVATRLLHLNLNLVMTICIIIVAYVENLNEMESMSLWKQMEKKKNDVQMVESVEK